MGPVRGLTGRFQGVRHVPHHEVVAQWHVVRGVGEQQAALPDGLADQIRRVVTMHSCIERVVLRPGDADQKAILGQRTPSGGQDIGRVRTVHQFFRDGMERYIG